MKTKVYVIAHTHWDREWYFTTEDSRVLLSYNFKKVLQVLKNNPAYLYFTLDGQSSLLEDYLAINPDDGELIRELATAGKLIIGPWFTQSDTLVPGGESIVRNLLYGIDIARRYGPVMMLGYLPDSFGQSAQLPQIFNGFGLECAVFWRGIAREDAGSSEFIWQGADGSEIVAVWIPFGYGDGRHWTADKDVWQYKVRPLAENLHRLSKTGAVMYVCGGDQVAIDNSLPEVIAQYNLWDDSYEYHLANYHQYCQLARAEAGRLPRLTGEFTRARHARIHKSIYSSRMDIKQAAKSLENKLVFLVEPLSCIGWQLGLDYPGGLLARAWKYLLESQAHDSIGCCNVDNTNADIVNRLRKATEIADGVVNVITRQLTGAVAEEDEIVVYNTLPYSRDEVVEFTVYTRYPRLKVMDGRKEVEFQQLEQSVVPGGRDTMLSPEGEKEYPLPDYYASRLVARVENVPAMGYKKIRLVDGGGDRRRNWLRTAGYEIENQYLRVSYRPHAGLDIYDKVRNRLYRNCLVFEDGGDDGDSYDYSPPVHDNIYYEAGQAATTEVIRTSLLQVMRYSFDFAVPADLAARRHNQRNTSLAIGVEVRLKAGEDQLEFIIDVNNTARDHRLRVLFPSNIPARVSYADQQFGHIERPTANPDAEGWREKGWRELPNTIEPMQSYCALAVENGFMAVVSANTPEYQIVGDDRSVVAITLFRGYSHLGKHDLLHLSLIHI
ncbi:MAG: hypothetical protein N3A57_06785, partial [Negativicutes bacterium]|nr:hypothetical protein [Negativicutes bacterium]